MKKYQIQNILKKMFPLMVAWLLISVCGCSIISLSTPSKYWSGNIELIFDSDSTYQLIKKDGSLFPPIERGTWSSKGKNRVILTRDHDIEVTVKQGLRENDQPDSILFCRSNPKEETLSLVGFPDGKEYFFDSSGCLRTPHFSLYPSLTLTYKIHSPYNFDAFSEPFTVKLDQHESQNNSFYLSVRGFSFQVYFKPLTAFQHEIGKVSRTAISFPDKNWRVKLWK